MSQRFESHGVNTGRIGAGLIVFGMGAIMLLDRSGLWDVSVRRFLPGFAVLAIGLAQAAGVWCSGDRGRHRPFRGVWLIVVGCWLLASEARVFGLDYGTSWPLLVIAVGTLIVIRELTSGSGDRRLPPGQEY